MKVTLTGGPADGRIVTLPDDTPVHTIRVPVLADDDLVDFHYSAPTGTFIGEAGRQNWADLSAQVMRDTMAWIWRDYEPPPA